MNAAAHRCCTATAAVAAGALLVSIAQAQDAYGVSARVPRNAFDSSRSEDAVDRERGDRAGASNVGDTLEQADHVVMQRTSSASAAPIVRGLTGYRVLLLADELRLNDSLTRPGGNALLNLLDPESVARIEVVRGPSSVRYGSDALGGVVRVHTAGVEAAPTAEADAGASVYARGASAERALRVQGTLHGVKGGFGARVSGGRGHAGEVLRGGGLGQQPFTGHDDWSLASRLEAAPSRDHRVWLSHQSGHLFDVPRTDVSTPEDRQETRLSESDRNDTRICEDGPDACERTEGYADFTLRAGLRLGPGSMIALSLENVLDAGYKAYASGAYAPGRNFTLAVRGSI